MIDSIIRNITPLTYKDVGTEIKRMISGSGAITSNNILASNSESNHGAFWGRVKCTPMKFQGPHPSAECFSKPESFDARDKRMHELISAGKWRGHIPTNFSNTTTTTSNHATPSTITELTNAMRQISTQGNNIHTTVLNTEFYCSNNAKTAPIVQGDWGLNDTGASHHIFNTTEHFVANSLIRNTDPTKRLTLAGGNQTLKVHSIGTTAFKDSVDGRIEFRESLYIPSLNIAGGALFKARVSSVVNPSNPMVFAMFCNRRLLFDGFFSGN